MTVDVPRTHPNDLQPPPRWWQSASLARVSLIIALTCIAYFPVTYAGYIWDDDDYVTENPLLFDAQGLWDIWFSIKQPSQYFPLTYTSFWFEYRVWGLHPLGYHINNVLLHAANACLIWLILKRLRVSGALAGALLFAVHPVHVESVAWVTERKNTLSTLFYLLAVLHWVRWLHACKDDRAVIRRSWWLAMLFFVLAMFAKTTACTLAPILILLAMQARTRLATSLVLRIVPFFVAGAVMGLITIWYEHVKQGTTGETFAMSLFDRGWIASRALWFYLGKLIYPIDLAFSYTRWDVDGRLIWWSYSLAVVGLAIGLWLSRKKLGPAPLVAAGVFFCSLLPLIGFIPLYTFLYSFVADHYQYVASVGVLALAGHLLTRTRLGSVAACIVILALAGLTAYRADIYRSSESLWRDTLVKNPTSWMAYLNLGQTLAIDPTRKDEAIAAFERAYALAPDRMETLYRLGTARFAQEKFDDAIKLFDESLAREPRFVEALLMKGRTFERQNRPDAAEVCYRQVVAQRSTYAAAWLSLGDLLERTDRPDDAIRAYESALAARRDFAEAHHALANLLRKRNNPQAAEMHYRLAIAAQPTSVESLVNLGDLLYAQRRFPEAASCFKEALRHQPNLEVAKRGLTAAEARVGR